VRNRENWFETRVANIKEQMTKNPEFFISLPEKNKKDQSKTTSPSNLKRQNTFETEGYDPKSPKGSKLTLFSFLISSQRNTKNIISYNDRDSATRITFT